MLATCPRCGCLHSDAHTDAMFRACTEAYEVIRQATETAIRTLAAAEPELTQYWVHSAVRQLLHRVADDAALERLSEEVAPYVLPPIDF